MRTLKRPMFRKGGSANEGIMTGLVDRRGYAKSNAADLFERMDPFAETYGISSPILSTDYTSPENIEKWSKPDTDFDFFKWAVKDKAEERKIADIEKERFDRVISYPTIEEPEKKPTDGGLNGANKISQQLLKEKQDTLSDKAKRYAEILSPGARKRAIYDSLAAASEAFGQSTGDTKQDIANAISAAAKASGGAKDVLDKANLLALQEEIQTNIAKATYKPNVMESTINFYRSLGMNDSQIAKKIGKDTAHITDYLRASTTEKSGYKNWALGEFGDSENWGGFLPETKEGTVDKDKVKEFMTPGKFYWDQDKRIFVGLVEGKVQQVSPK